MARQTLERSIKFKGLIQALGIPRPCVRGLLETMWDVAHECGNPKLGTPRQVELAAEWYGEPGVFFAALADLEWIDEIEDSPGRWEIHDYWDHAPKSAAGRAQREAEREMKGTSLSELRAEAGRRGGLAKAGKTLANPSNLLGEPGNRKQTPSKSSHSRHPTPDTGSTTSKGVSGSISEVLPGVESTAPAPPGGPPPRSPAQPKVKAADVPIPEELDTPGFRAAWAGRRQERDQRGRDGMQTPAQINAQFASLVEIVKAHGIGLAIECVRRATAGGSKNVVYPDWLPGARNGGGGKATGYHPAGRPVIVAGIDRTMLGAAADPDEHERELQAMHERQQADARRMREQMVAS